MRKIALYSDLIYTLIRLEISRRTRQWCLKCVIVYLAQAIQAFVMYCVNGTSCSSLLIESTDSMIESTDSMIYTRMQNHFNKMKKEVGMLLQKSTDTRGVGDK